MVTSKVALLTSMPINTVFFIVFQFEVKPINRKVELTTAFRRPTAVRGQIA
jgi:hypothetical protein